MVCSIALTPVWQALSGPPQLAEALPRLWRASSTAERPVRSAACLAWESQDCTVLLTSPVSPHTDPAVQRAHLSGKHCPGRSSCLTRCRASGMTTEQLAGFCL